MVKMAKTIVKKEKAPAAAPLCVNGLKGKQLSNVVNYKLRSAPEWIKLYWEGKVKYDKAGTSDEKKNCIEAIMSDAGWENPFFKRIRDLNKIDEDKTESTWMSWKKLLENEDETVVTLMISQQKILTRPHALLDHEADDTKSLPEHLRLQYMYVVDSEKSAIESIDSFHRSMDGIPDEKASTIDDDTVKTVMASVRKARGHWNSNKIDLEVRLKKFEENKYQRVGVVGRGGGGGDSQTFADSDFTFVFKYVFIFQN